MENFTGKLVNGHISYFSDIRNNSERITFYYPDDIQCFCHFQSGRPQGTHVLQNNLLLYVSEIRTFKKWSLFFREKDLNDPIIATIENDHGTFQYYAGKRPLIQEKKEVNSEKVIEEKYQMLSFACSRKLSEIQEKQHYKTNVLFYLPELVFEEKLSDSQLVDWMNKTIDEYMDNQVSCPLYLQSFSLKTILNDFPELFEYDIPSEELNHILELGIDRIKDEFSAPPYPLRYKDEILSILEEFLIHEKKRFSNENTLSSDKDNPFSEQQAIKDNLIQTFYERYNTDEYTIVLSPEKETAFLNYAKGLTVSPKAMEEYPLYEYLNKRFCSLYYSRKGNKIRPRFIAFPQLKSLFDSIIQIAKRCEIIDQNNKFLSFNKMNQFIMEYDSLQL